jgi:hypothetical protein
MQIELEDCSNWRLLLHKAKIEKNNCNPRLALQKNDDVEWGVCRFLFLISGWVSRFDTAFQVPQPCFLSFLYISM